MATPINNKIVSSGKPLPELEYMKYPTWLKMDDLNFQTLFLDIVALREYYSTFFQLQNPTAQMEIGQSLLQRLTHTEACIYNKYDISLNAQQYAKEQVEFINDKWLDMLGNVIELKDTSELSIEAYVDEETGIQLHGGPELKKLVDGTLDEDFLHQHPSTKKNFISFALSAWMRRNNNTNTSEE